MGLLKIISRQYHWYRWSTAFFIISFWSTSAFCQTGIITTVAGTGTPGFSGDGGNASDAELERPHDIEVDEDGNIYISDRNNYRIRKIDNNNTITTIAGNGTAGYGGDGSLAINAKFLSPQGIAIDSNRNVYIAEGSVVCRIRKVNSINNIITTVAGIGGQGYNGDGIAATAAYLRSPSDVEVDQSGNFYIADLTNRRIRKVDISTGLISTVAGNGVEGFDGDGGKATDAELYRPWGIALDKNNNLYIADQNRIRKVDANGNINTIAGQIAAGFSGDGGLAVNAQLTNAFDIILDNNNNLFISDSGNHRIRKVDSYTGNISTIAGNGSAAYSGDSGLATEASLQYPTGITLTNNDQTLLIADKANNRIRSVSLPSNTDNLSISPLLKPLNTDSNSTLNFTVKYSNSASSPVNLGESTITGNYHQGAFEINTGISNNCISTTLEAGEFCTLSITYTSPSNTSQSEVSAVLNVKEVSGAILTQALITSGEDDDNEAARRLPDVLTSVNVPALTAGNPATITWTMTGYQTDAYSQIALFECNTDNAGNVISTCGDSYANRTVASAVLSPDSTIDGGWTFREAQAKDRTYSYTYTPSKTGPVVLRFYQKSGLDKDADNSGTSLLIPGGLNGAGSSFEYFDAEGRRIKATVQ